MFCSQFDTNLVSILWTKNLHAGNYSFKAVITLSLAKKQNGLGTVQSGDLTCSAFAVLIIDYGSKGNLFVLYFLPHVPWKVELIHLVK